MLSKITSFMFPCNQRFIDAVEKHKSVKMEVIDEIKKATSNIIGEKNESH